MRIDQGRIKGKGWGEAITPGSPGQGRVRIKSRLLKKELLLPSKSRQQKSIEDLYKIRTGVRSVDTVVVLQNKFLRM